MTLVPFSPVHCVTCRRGYSPAYEGRCVTTLRYRDGRTEPCPGPLIQVLVDVPDDTERSE